MSTDANQFLMGGGIQSAKFEKPGDSITGVITDTEVRQQTDLNTGALKVWDDGRPMMQLVVTLQTELREDADDDGLRRVYIKGKSLTENVREAVRKTGAKGLEIGGKLQVSYVGDGEVKKRGFNPPKLYLAQYARPAAQEADAFLMSPAAAKNFADSPFAQQPAAPAWPQQQPTAQPPF